MEQQKIAAVNVDIDNIIDINKWKRIKPKLEAMIGKSVNSGAYGRNEWIVLFTDESGRISTMATIGGIKTVEALKEYLLKFDDLRIEKEQRQ